MNVTDECLRNNAVYAEGFSGPLPLPPARHVAVVAAAGWLDHAAVFYD
jgi:carbonic anhydrase